MFGRLLIVLVCVVLRLISTTEGAPWPPQFDSGPSISGFRSKSEDPPKSSAKIVTSGAAPACRCIDVRDCPAIVAQLQWRPIDEALRKRLRATACGFRGSEPQVCCPDFDFEGRLRRTPHHHHSWDDWEDNEDYTMDAAGHNHFGNFPFPPEPKETTVTRNKPRRQKTRPVIWPTDDFQTSTSTTEIPTTTTMKLRPKPKSNNGGRILNNNNASLVNPRICGVAINNRIIGGDDAGPGQFPWVARIGYRSPGASRLLYRCGGAMINKDYVITAAHCVTNLPQTLQLAGIRLGEVEDRSDLIDCTGTDCTDAPQDFRVGRIIVHPRYDTPRFANDIALIRLSRSANLTGYVSPICLPVGKFRLGQDDNLTGNSAIVAGWGSMTPDSATSSTSLQWVRLTVGDLADCRTIYKNRFNISVTTTHMCTKPRANVDACQGDSGGPLVMESPNERYLLAGIVSFGPRRCGTADLPGVYTRVSSFVDWVVANVRP